MYAFLSAEEKKAHFIVCQIDRRRDSPFPLSILVLGRRGG